MSTTELLAEILDTLQRGNITPGTAVERQGYQNVIWGSQQTFPGGQLNAAGALVPVPWREILRTPTLAEPRIFTVTLASPTNSTGQTPDQVAVARVRWAIGGAAFQQEVDWLNGYSFTVAAQQVSIDGRGDPVSAPTPIRLTAGASIGAATSRPAQRTLVFPDLASGVTSPWQELPAFTRSMRYMGGRAYDGPISATPGSHEPVFVEFAADTAGPVIAQEFLGRRIVTIRHIFPAVIDSIDIQKPSWAAEAWFSWGSEVVPPAAFTWEIRDAGGLVFAAADVTGGGFGALNWGATRGMIPLTHESNIVRLYNTTATVNHVALTMRSDWRDPAQPIAVPGGARFVRLVEGDFSAYSIIRPQLVCTLEL